VVFHDTINLPWPVGDPGQIWQRGFENTDGYFSLQIANSSLFLTATGVDTQQIQGNNVYSHIWAPMAPICSPLGYG
jgi:hypothetical protein